MLLSESVSNALSGGDESVVAGLIGASTLIGLNLVVAVVTARSATVQTILQGEPVLVGKDGHIFRDALRRQHVPESDLRQALREADCELESMQCAFLEADGRISILKKPEAG